MVRLLTRLALCTRWRRSVIRSYFDWERLRTALGVHVARWGLLTLLVASVALAFHARYTMGVNVTASLPYHVFVIAKGEHPARGQYVAFRWPGGGPYPAGVTFVKQIVGAAGDVITQVDRQFFVNGMSVGVAKPLSRSGRPLAPGPTGTLAAGQYYVRAPHPDSLDSRYALLGWISESEMIGRAYVLF